MRRILLIWPVSCEGSRALIKNIYGVSVEDVNKKDAGKLAAELVENMRREDYDESILFGIDPLQNVRFSIEASEVVYTLMAGETLLGVFGLGESSAPVIWFLGTEAVKKHPKALVAIGYSFIEDMVKEHGYVVNYISLANRPAIRYIKGVRHVGLICETKEDGIGMYFKIRRGTCAESQG